MSDRIEIPWKFVALGEWGAACCKKQPTLADARKARDCPPDWKCSAAEHRLAQELASQGKPSGNLGLDLGLIVSRAWATQKAQNIWRPITLTTLMDAISSRLVKAYTLIWDGEEYDAYTDDPLRYYAVPYLCYGIFCGEEVDYRKDRNDRFHIANPKFGGLTPA